MHEFRNNRQHEGEGQTPHMRRRRPSPGRHATSEVASGTSVQPAFRADERDEGDGVQFLVLVPVG
jgi:hypothetical protein